MVSRTSLIFGTPHSITDFVNGPFVHMNVLDTRQCANREQSRLRGSTRAVAISALQLNETIFQGPGAASRHDQSQAGMIASTRSDLRRFANG